MNGRNTPQNVKSLAYLASEALLKGAYKSNVNLKNRKVNVHRGYLKKVNNALRKQGIRSYVKNLLSRNVNNIPKNYENVIRGFDESRRFKNRYVNMIKMYKKNIHPSNDNYRRILRGYIENMQRVFLNIQRRENYITTKDRFPYFPKYAFYKIIFDKKNEKIYRNFKKNYIKNIMNTKLLHVGPNKRMKIIMAIDKRRSGSNNVQTAMNIYYARKGIRSRNLF